MSRLPVMGKLKPFIFDEGSGEFLCTTEIPELSFGGVFEVPVTKQIQDSISNLRYVASSEFEIVHS